MSSSGEGESLQAVGKRIEARLTPERRRLGRFLRRKLKWNQIYRAASYLRSALWLAPFGAILLVLIAAPFLRALDAWLGWRLSGLEVSGAQSLYQTVITLTLSFVVFTFGSLLVAIQIAGGQLTPRIIATTLLRDNVVRYSVGLFVVSLMFAIVALNRLNDRVPVVITFVIGVLGVASMATFLFLIDYAARLLRPVSVVARVGDEGLKVIKAVYPELIPGAADVDDVAPLALGPPRRTVSHAGLSEIVLALDVDALVSEAILADGVIEFVPQVGDFLAQGETLFALHGGAASIDDRTLRAAVAFGTERTMEQDPIFSFRILADIGLKALSPAINDPTTAVLALDQLHRLLRAVGRRRLRTEVIADERGEARLIHRTPVWEDFVNVSCQEIRSCGAGNVQIARRLRAMLDNLIDSLPVYRHESLRLERERLDRTIDALYALPEDRALARIPDTQGLGGSSQAVRQRS